MFLRCEGGIPPSAAALGLRLGGGIPPRRSSSREGGVPPRRSSSSSLLTRGGCTLERRSCICRGVHPPPAATPGHREGYRYRRQMLVSWSSDEVHPHALTCYAGQQISDPHALTCFGPRIGSPWLRLSSNSARMNPTASRNILTPLPALHEPVSGPKSKQNLRCS